MDKRAAAALVAYALAVRAYPTTMQRAEPHALPASLSPRSCDGCNGEHGVCFNGICTCHPAYAGPASRRSLHAPTPALAMGCARMVRACATQAIKGSHATCLQMATARTPAQATAIVRPTDVSAFLVILVLIALSQPPRVRATASPWKTGRAPAVEGYGGVACDVPLCADSCSGHGHCAAPGRCVCAHGWSGPTCSVEGCAGGVWVNSKWRVCSGHGVCTIGTGTV